MLPHQILGGSATAALLQWSRRFFRASASSASSTAAQHFIPTWSRLNIALVAVGCIIYINTIMAGLSSNGSAAAVVYVQYLPHV